MHKARTKMVRLVTKYVTARSLFGLLKRFVRTPLPRDCAHGRLARLHGGTLVEGVAVRREIGRLITALETGTCISELIAADEIAAGRRVIRPGDAPWLPPDDWEPGTLCAVKDGRARLVLLHAKRENAGALTRLLAALARAGLKPSIVAPTRELQATMARRGWRKIRNKDEWVPSRPSPKREGAEMSIYESPVATFFLETCACGPGAAGEWRAGGDLVREFQDWANVSATRDIRLSFYDEMRALGFAQVNKERVYFFVPVAKRAAREEGLKAAGGAE